MRSFHRGAPHPNPSSSPSNPFACPLNDSPSVLVEVESPRRGLNFTEFAYWSRPRSDSSSAAMPHFIRLSSWRKTSSFVRVDAGYTGHHVGCGAKVDGNGLEPCHLTQFRGTAGVDPRRLCLGIGYRNRYAWRCGGFLCRRTYRLHRSSLV